LKLGKYASIVLGAVALGLGAAYAWAPRVDAAGRWAALFGALVAAANAILAYSLVLWSAGRSTRAFLGAVLGGMVGRQAAMLSAVAAGILLLGLPALPLVTSLLAFFALFLVLELAIVQKRAGRAAGAR
jgi:hypothetical protein